MKRDRKLRTGLIGGGPGAFIGEVRQEDSFVDTRMGSNGVKTPVRRPRVCEKTEETNVAPKQEEAWSIFLLVLGVAVFLIVLSVCAALVVCFSDVLGVAVFLLVLSMFAALVVYFSDPHSAHKEGLQRTLIEALIMTCMASVGAIIALLTGRLR